MSIIDDLNNLDSNPGLWPFPIKIGSFVLTFIVILFLAWKVDITKQRDSLSSLEVKEKEQVSILDIKQKKAANLEALKDQLKEIEQSFGDLLKQLPNKTEVAGLLVDISQTGLSAGLEFKLFEPKGENRKEFYAELPINIIVKGDYHQLGEFVSGIAALPRIVTTHDINISKSPKDTGGKLKMSAVAKTYRAITAEESDAENEEEN